MFLSKILRVLKLGDMSSHAGGNGSQFGRSYIKLRNR